MSVETRNLETRYFDADDLTVIRVERVRGQFDAYDGSFKTLAVNWFLETAGNRRSITLSEIGELISGHDDIEPVGLANYFADAYELGHVISADFTGHIDFQKTFDRKPCEMFPRIENRNLYFTTSKSFGEPIVSDSNFYDVSADLQSLEIDSKMFWSGNCRDLVITLDPRIDR